VKELIVTCPYAEPNCDSDDAVSGQRCRCGGFVKRCPDCATQNRAFSNFCRACGARLPLSKTNWSGYRGSSRRLGVNPARPRSSWVVEKTDLEIRLGDPCRSLLGYDGHLVALSLSGVVEVADPARARSVGRFLVPGPITAEPCIRDGVLYLATRGQLSAYSLAAITMEPPRVRPLWQLPLNGTPIHALTTVHDRLYVTLASSDWREIQVIEGLDRGQQPDGQQPVARSLHGAPRVSWVAADPGTARAAFLSETNGGGVQLHIAQPALTSHPVPLRSLSDHPIAFLSGSIFGVFGESQRLYRISASSGAVEEPLDEDALLFALTHDAEEEWDRDGAVINSAGISFSRAGVRESIEPYERAVKGSPLIVRGCAVAVGMEDGRVRIYDLTQLPRQDVWYVGGSQSTAAITALASFDSYVAAGNRDGIVEVCELRARGAAR
jgi:hypothetical protein